MCQFVWPNDGRPGWLDGDDDITTDLYIGLELIVNAKIRELFLFYFHYLS